MKLPLFAAAMAMTATAAFAQTEAPNVPDAFVMGVKACAKNVVGALPLNPPSDAMTEAGLVAADPAGADELAAFADLDPSTRNFAAVISEDQSVGIAVGSDLTKNLCRVAVFDASSAKVMDIVSDIDINLAGDWKEEAGQAGAPVRVFHGTIEGSSPLTIRVREPGLGAANIMVTVINEPL